MAFDVGVRQALVNSGIANDQIGWDQKTGYVTVGGQNFMQPQKNIQGTTFTDQPSFNQALSAYNKSIQPTVIGNSQPVQQAQRQQAQPTQPMQYQPPNQSYSNPMDSQISDLIGAIMSQMNNTQPFDPYSSPEFAAQEARSQRAAQQGIRAAQESMGSAGFGRSTALGERAQGIQNEQEEYLRTQVIPSIIAQNEQRKQQDLQNRMALLNPLMSQQNVFDSRNQFDRNFSLSEGQLTGNYMPTGAQEIIDNLLDLKRQAEQKDASGRNIYQGQDLQNLSSQADALRSQLIGMGIDPSFIGADVNMDTAALNRGRAGVRTLAAQGQDFNQNMAMQQFEYQQARDAIADQRYKIEFDQDNERFGLQYALNKAVQLGQLDISRMNANTSRMSANASIGNANFNRAMELWKATGVAPEGIPNVKPGTQWSQSNPGPEQFQAQIIEGINSFESLEDALGWISANSKEITSQLGARGYEEMRRSAQNQFAPPDTKAEADLRSRAINYAQNDLVRWNRAKTKEEQEALINEYIDLLRVQ